ncbi:MAG: ABC transporter substrate-binding protein [Clostridiales bacterium]|jgi:putative aldouronate transport system substrate-binding protein|nr:ABC transporter substrate-binding protein [Clostridiales bacterium]
MVKKIIAIVLALTMLTALAACGTSGQQAATTAAATTAAATTAAAATEAATTAAATTAEAAATTAAATTAAATEAATTAAAPVASDLAPYEITYYMYCTIPSDQHTVIEQALNEIIQPKFNATIKFTMITGAEWDTKALVPLRAGEKIDIFWTPEWMHYMSNINNGSLLKLNDPSAPHGDLLATYAPQTVIDLGAFIPANQVGGFNYAVPTNKELCVPGGLIWNKDYVEKYNIDITAIDDYEEIEPYLKQFKDENPGYYPLLATTGWSFKSPFIQGYLNNMDPIGLRIGEPNARDGVPEFIWEAPEVLTHVDWMTKWVAAGYVNPDSQLKTYNTIDELNAGKFLITFDQVLKGGQVKSHELEGQSGNPDLKLIEQQTSASVNVTTHAGGSMLGIPVSSRDPARAMMYIDSMHQDEKLLNIMAWGIDGTHYTLDDRGMVLPKAMNGWSDSHGGMWTLGNRFKQLLAASEDPEKYKQMAALTAEAWNHESLGFRFDQAGFESEYAAIYNVSDQLQKGILSGVNGNNGVPEIIAQYKAAGVDKVLDAVKEAYAAWKQEVYGQ